MKKTILLLGLLVVAFALFTIQSCDNEEPVAFPVVTAPTEITAVQVGTKVDMTFAYVAAGGYDTAVVTASGGTATVKTHGAPGSVEGSVVVEFTANNTSGVATVTLTVTDAKGQAGNAATATLNKTISAPPTVTLSSASASANPGFNVTVTATVEAPNGFKSLTYTTTGGLTGAPASPINSITGTTQLLTFTIPTAAAIGSTMTAVISVTDNQNLNSTPQVFTVTATTNELTGTLAANMTLNKGASYLIKNTFIVPSGLTLTVQAGAIIKGDRASKGVLVIKQGGILNAIGTSTEPIVFTSSQPAGERDRGDWGGIIIMGDAFVNQSAQPSVEGLTPPASDANYFKYGRESTTNASVGNNTQNSGTLKYVRIEYAGIELLPNSETNGLTMAAVGDGTTIDYVQVSYGGDDGFEWFGGTVNARHLVSMAMWDDDFDTDFGWRGNVQWALSVRAPAIADQSGSTAFESDSQGNANAIGTICDGVSFAGCTRGVFSNVTVLGPRDFNAGTGPSSNVTRAISGNFTRAMHIRRRAAISIFNSFVSGWGAATNVQGLTIDDAGTITNYTTLAAGVLANNVLLFPDAAADAEYGSNEGGSAAVKPIWEATASANLIVKPAVAAAWAPVAGTPSGSINVYTTYGITTGNSSGLFYGTQTTANYPSNPNFAVASGDLTGQLPATLFASPKLGNFFDKSITYKGAFGDTDWTDGWSEFQPLNKVY
jgi:hypothetical protein